VTILWPVRAQEGREELRSAWGSQVQLTIGAEGGTRTHKPLREAELKARVCNHSATSHRGTARTTADGYVRTGRGRGPRRQRGKRGRTGVDNLRGIRKPRVIGSTPIAGSIRNPLVRRPLQTGAFSVYIRGVYYQLATSAGDCCQVLPPTSNTVGRPCRNSQCSHLQGSGSPVKTRRSAILVGCGVRTLSATKTGLEGKSRHPAIPYGSDDVVGASP
jgi:hypothetical protein